MKIAIIAPYWNPPSFYGGISRVIYELRKIWVQKGYTVHVYASNTIEDKSNGIFKLPSPAIPYRTLWNNIFLRYHNILKDYDIIFPQTAIACIGLDKNKTIPFIHTLSGIEYRNILRFWRYGHTFLEKIALRGISKCIVLDDKTKKSLINSNFFKPKDILKVNNGVDFKKFTPGSSKMEEKNFKVITAGRFIPRKRFDLLIHIFSEFVRTRSDAILQLAGDGELRENLISITKKLNIDNNVEFLGQLSEQELINHFQTASLFILTSEAEGMPMVVLEAQSCGLPVITSAFESSKNLIIENITGFIINGSKVEPWIDKISELYDNVKLRKSFSKKTRERIMTDFTWEKTSSEILNLFNSIKNVK